MSQQGWDSLGENGADGNEATSPRTLNPESFRGQLAAPFSAGLGGGQIEWSGGFPEVMRLRDVDSSCYSLVG
jgi:hypothetical protein